MIEYVLSYMKHNRVIGSVVLLGFILVGAFLLSRNRFRMPFLKQDHISPSIVLQKPRDKVVEYVVQDGDTIFSVGEKWGISVDTVKWSNGLTSNSLTAVQTLKIFPVTGVAHVVVKGDTVESLALKYHTTVQKIIDFPFNEYAKPETYELIPGKTFIIQGGRM